MKILDRFIVFIMGLLLLVLSLAMVAYAAPLAVVVNYIGTSLDNLVGSIEMGVAGIILFIVTFRLLWISFKVEKEEQTVGHTTEIGEVRISLTTIESLVMEVANNKKGIKEVKSNIKAREDGVFIYIKSKVSPDLEIPQLSEELQQEVKAYVESKAGVEVSTVKVMIENILKEKVKSGK